MSVTRDDILDAIRASLVGGADDLAGVTTTEIVAVCDPPRSVLAVRRDLRRLMAEGRVEAVRVRRVRMDGMPTVVSAYRLKG